MLVLDTNSRSWSKFTAPILNSIERRVQRRMKALLFTLLRAFEFQLSATDIKRKALIVLRPVLASNPNGKNQLPLLVKVYQHP